MERSSGSSRTGAISGRFAANPLSFYCALALLASTWLRAGRRASRLRVSGAARLQMQKQRQKEKEEKGGRKSVPTREKLAALSAGQVIRRWLLVVCVGGWQKLHQLNSFRKPPAHVCARGTPTNAKAQAEERMGGLKSAPTREKNAVSRSRGVAISC